MSEAPRGRLANLPLSTRQVLIIVVCVLLIAIDGFDVLSISFAAPGIAAQWGIERAALGLVRRGARELRERGTVAYAAQQIPQAELNALFERHRDLPSALSAGPGRLAGLR